MCPLTAISLYTGAGGLDLGFEAAGFVTRAAIEMDPDAIATIRHNRDWPLLPFSIHDERASTESIRKISGLAQGEADVLIGGPPCQPFSKSGYWASGDAKRLADPRASTLGAYLRVLREMLPKAFLLENVPGIAFTAKDEGIRFLQREIERLNADTGSSYTFHAEILRAVHFGVPQDRHRVFIVGHRDGRPFQFPAPRHGDAAERDLLRDGLEPIRTAWDAIGDLQDDDEEALRVTGKWAALLSSIPEGHNYLHHTDRGRGVPIFGWRRRYWNFLLKLAKDRPSWTIAAQPGPAIGPFHWKNRRLSGRELCRLQTFPDDYRVIGTLRAVQKQVGNAVPSALAERIALEMRAQLFDDSHAPTTSPKLVPARRGPIPPPEPVTEVPPEFWRFVGNHDPHPGTGMGYRAGMRAVQ